MSIEQMREALKKVYDSWRWRNKVDAMSEKQVYAVYCKFLEQGKFKDLNKKVKERGIQLTIFDIVEA